MGVAVTAGSCGAQPCPGSYTAHDATVSPAISASMVAAYDCGSVESTSPASTVLTGYNGPGATVLPSCSATIARSATPSPETLPPPSSSGTSRAVQPSSAARCHQSWSNESPAACSSRTRLSGTSFWRKAWVVEAKSIFSGESTAVMMLARPSRPIRSQSGFTGAFDGSNEQYSKRYRSSVDNDVEKL